MILDASNDRVQSFASLSLFFGLKSNKTNYENHHMFFGSAAVDVKEEGEEKEDDYGSEESAEESSDSEEEEESSDEESESIEENTTEDAVKPLAWKHKLGLAIAEADGSPGSPAVSEDSVEPLPKKLKKQIKNGPSETDGTASVTVSVSAAEAVQALVNFSSPSENVVPSAPTSSSEAVSNLSSDTNVTSVEKPKAEGIGMALRTKVRSTPQRTLVVPTVSTPKSSSRSKTSSPVTQPTNAGSNCSVVGADLSASQVKIPAVLLQHGIVKMKPPKPKAQPVPVEPRLTTTSKSGQRMEDQITTLGQSTAIPSANVVPTTAVISPAVSSPAQPSSVVKKTVLVFSQPMDIETTEQITSKSSRATLAALPKSSVAPGKALSPAMFDTRQSTALKQILTPTRTSSVSVSVPLAPPPGQKLLVPPSSQATPMPLLSKPAGASKVVQKVPMVPTQKRTVVKKMPTAAGQSATQQVRNSQSVATSPLFLTAANVAKSKPLTVSHGSTLLSSKPVATPTVMSASTPPVTVAGLLSTGTATAPASVAVVHREQPMASAVRLQQQHASRVISGPTVNPNITLQSVSKSASITTTPAVKVLLSVPASAQTQAVGAKYLPATLQAVQRLCVPNASVSTTAGGASTIPRVSSTAATSTIRLLTQPAGTQSVQPISQASPVARTVISRPIATSIPSAKAAPHSSATMPLAFVATTTIAQLPQRSITTSPATAIPMPSALLAKLPQQPAVQKVAGISALPVHSPAVEKHLKAAATPATTTIATQLVSAHSKQYALATTAGRVATTSVATAHPRSETLQKAVIPTTVKTGTHSNQHVASTKCVTTAVSSPVPSTHRKQAELQASVTTPSPSPGTHTKQYAANTDVMQSPTGITHSKALPTATGAEVSPSTGVGAQCKKNAETVMVETTVAGSSPASEAPPTIHGVSSGSGAPMKQCTDSTPVPKTVSEKTAAVKKSFISVKDQPEGREVRECTTSSVGISLNSTDYSPSSLLVTCQTSNIKPVGSNCTTQDKTNGCSNTASAKKELSSSVLVGGSSILKRSANSINGELDYIPRKKCKGDDTPNGMFSNVVAEEQCVATNTELENSSSKEKYVSTSGNNVNKETSLSKSGSTEAEICNGVITPPCEKLEDVEMEQLKSTENCCLKTYCNGLTVEHTGKESTNQ